MTPVNAGIPMKRLPPIAKKKKKINNENRQFIGNHLAPLPYLQSVKIEDYRKFHVTVLRRFSKFHQIS